MELNPTVVYSIVNAKSNYSTEYILKILLSCQDMNPVWLLKGKHKEKKTKKHKKTYLKTQGLDHTKELQAIKDAQKTTDDKVEALEQGQKNLDLPRRRCRRLKRGWIVG